MIKDIKKWIIIALSFAATLWLIGAVYWAWINIDWVSNWQTLDATLINNIIDNQNDLNNRISWLSTTVAWLLNVPTWAVMAFNLASCPTWWIAADGTNWTRDLRWTFIRWINWVANSRDVSRTLWSYQDDDFQAHKHTQWWDAWTNSSYRYGVTTWLGWTVYSDMYGLLWSNGNAINTSTEWWTETRPKNIALLYCQKL